MAAPQRPGEITYYDELGVDHTASSDEIRDAFRTLARLLHPDAQTEPLLKEMAERQMRKLNRIHSTLSDANRRAAYDESLNSSRHAPIIVFSGSDGNLKKLLTRWGTVAAIVFGAFLLIWFAFDSSSSSEVRGQDTRGVANRAGGDAVGADGEAGDQIARLRARIRTLETERNSALEQLGALNKRQSPFAAAGKDGKDPVAALPALQSTATDLKELNAKPSANPVAVSASPTPEAAVPAGQFAGLWVYSKSPGSASPGGKAQYPPEFIEVTVTEQNGTLRGQYHSRYQVLDHAISPDVDFVFSGTPSGTALNCLWHGPGGSRGRMTLTLLPTNTVEIAWNATELGSEQWLVNGTAMLAKK